MNNFEKHVRIAIHSERFDHSESIFGNSSDDEITDNTQHDRINFITEGVFSAHDGRVSLSYDDSELLGGEETGVTLTFTEEQPGLLTMLRGGTVSTALVFETGKRHICVYKTPYMPFEVCIRTYKVKNRLLNDGHLNLDYIIEIHGVRAERTKMNIVVSEPEALS